MKQLVLIAHNLRSTHNVGSLLRTAEGLGVQEVFLTGYTPYPETKSDTRIPHISRKLSKQINKTALGAENMINWQHQSDVKLVIKELKHKGFQIIGLEQTAESRLLTDTKFDNNVALLVGREVEGVEPEILKLCDLSVEIPMQGKKESFNVAQACAMALYHLTFLD